MDHLSTNFDVLDLQSSRRNILAARTAVHAMFMASSDPRDGAFPNGAAP
jgi:hypothetical protein